ncbi:MAG: SRPBCC family protein [Verrucomicrobiia bacterium]
MGLSAVTEKIEIGAPVDKVFQFVTDTDQISRILPPALRATVLRRNARRLGPGVSLEVALRPLGFAFRAEVSVTAWRLNRHLAYAWRSGPFHPWEHDLYFESLSRTHCRVTHCLIYRPPLGLLGLVLDRVWFRHALRRSLRRLGPSWAAARDHSSLAPTHGLVLG